MNNKSNSQFSAACLEAATSSFANGLLYQHAGRQVEKPPGSRRASRMLPPAPPGTSNAPPAGGAANTAVAPPSAKATRVAPDQPPATLYPTTITCKPGDTLQGIAIKHKLRVNELKRLNRLYTSDARVCRSGSDCCVRRKGNLNRINHLLSRMSRRKQSCRFGFRNLRVGKQALDTQAGINRIKRRAMALLYRIQINGLPSSIHIVAIDRCVSAERKRCSSSGQSIATAKVA